MKEPKCNSRLVLEANIFRGFINLSHWPKWRYSHRRRNSTSRTKERHSSRSSRQTHEAKMCKSNTDLADSRGFPRILSDWTDFRGFSHEPIRVICENPLNPCLIAFKAEEATRFCRSFVCRVQIRVQIPITYW